MPAESTKQVRAKIPLLKGHVIARTAEGFTIQFGGFRVEAKVSTMPLLDIRDGDLLTAYVEVLFQPPKGTT